MKTHYLTPGSNVTDCGIAAYQHDVIRGKAQSEYGRPMKVSREEELVNCSRCRSVSSHRGVGSEAPHLQHNPQLSEKS